MPLMHSENAADIQKCKEELLLLAEQNKADEKVSQKYKMQAKFANDHLEVVEKFGRYPTRNAALGRETTPEEAEYLKTANSWG